MANNDLFDTLSKMTMQVRASQSQAIPVWLIGMMNDASVRGDAHVPLYASQITQSHVDQLKAMGFFVGEPGRLEDPHYIVSWSYQEDCMEDDTALEEDPMSERATTRRTFKSVIAQMDAKNDNALLRQELHESKARALALEELVTRQNDQLARYKRTVRILRETAEPSIVYNHMDYWARLNLCEEMMGGPHRR